MTPYILGLLVLIGWAVGDIFAGVASRKIGAMKTSFLVSIFGVLIFLPWFLHESGGLVEFTPWLFFLTITLSLFWTLGNVVLNFGIATAYPSIVATTAMSFAGVVVIFNSIFFDNHVGSLQWIAIAIIALGVVMTGIDLKKDEIEAKKLLRSVMLGLVSMLCWALYYTFIKIVADSTGWFLPLYITIVVSTIVTLIGSKGISTLVFKSTPILISALCFGSALVLRSSDFILNWSIKENLVGIVAPIGGASPVLFALLSFFVFKERLKPFQIVGVVTALIGIITLSFVS